MSVYLLTANQQRRQNAHTAATLVPFAQDALAVCSPLIVLVREEECVLTLQLGEHRRYALA